MGVQFDSSLKRPLLVWRPRETTCTVLAWTSAAFWAASLVLTVVLARAGRAESGEADLAVFLPTFPLFGAATLVLQLRRPALVSRGIRQQLARLDWMALAFRSLPRAWSIAYRLYFYGVWGVAMYTMMRQPHWPSSGLTRSSMFQLVPSVFYAVAFGVFWSERHEIRAGLRPPALPKL